MSDRHRAFFAESCCISMRRVVLDVASFVPVVDADDPSIFEQLLRRSAA